jgi:16S rRNA C1402 (ribose-2'-O) methylase RsmI
VLDALEEATIAGEYVIIVRGRDKGHVSAEEALEEVMALIKKGMGRKEAAKTVAAQYGLSSKELYDGSLKK